MNLQIMRGMLEEFRTSEKACMIEAIDVLIAVRL